MPEMRRRELIAAACPAALCGVLPARAQGLDEPPAAPREFRAAWVASVANIDWPSRPGLDAAAQRAETLAMLDRARELRLNALVLQVRPAGDALYASTLEPWSEYLTGAQGRAPSPPYDPLAFWVEEAHRRGLELHAWFNPYRARHPSAKTPLVASHLAQSRPGLVRSYGELMWMDPGEADAAAHTLAVMADVLQRYDIDGLHMDDYFYPYPVSRGGVETPFPDEPAWRRYQDGGGRLAREDWRRDNVDRLVQRLYALVRERKPHVRVGISPFGLGRPDRRPPGIQGFSQYDKLYADVERWLQEGWLDYLAPQLYWAIDRPAQAFGVLLDYWLAQNTRGRHIWPGLFTSRVGAPERERAWPAQEVIDQVALKRTRPAASGHLHFSMVALMQDREGLGTQLRAGAYAQPALVPVAPWLGGQAPAAPLATRDGAALRLRPGPGPGAAPFLWALWQRVAGRWQFGVQPAGAPGSTEPVALAAGAEAVVASAVDRQGLESPRVRVTLG
ncbi:MAG: glycoside hydrolase family 10 protein [Rubrivivax sp.]